MDLELYNKTALVTASSAGIGYAIAEQLALEGAAVYVNGRNSARVNEAIEKIKKKSSTAKVHALVADTGTKEGVDLAINALQAVDILINNLGIYEPKAFGDITDNDWLRLFEVNVLSGVRLSRYYLPLMLKKNWGRIVFISSESALQIPAEMIHYGTTKTAQLAIARGLAELTVGTNVTVNSVLPGPTRSEGVEEFIVANAKAAHKTPQQFEDEFFQTMRPTSLIKRFARPEEVANLVAYVASPKSSATNGAALRVDGGVVKAII